MSEWPMVKLGELGKWAAGGTPSRLKAEYFGGIIPWASIADLNDGFVSMTMESITELGLQNSSAKIYPKGSILIAMYGSIGKLGINVVPMASNQAIACFMPNETLERDYAFWALYSLRSELIMIGRGGTQKNIGQGILKEQKIPLPPLGEQKRIAEILGGVSKAIHAVEQQLQLVESVCVNSFERKFNLEMQNGARDASSIADFIESTQYGTSKKAKEDGDIPILRMGNVTYSGKIDMTDLKYIDLDERELEKFSLKNGDLLFNRTNSAELVGKTAVFESFSDQIISYAGYLVRARVNADSNPYYVSGYLNSPSGKAQLRLRAKAIVGMANINAREFLSLEIPAATKEEQGEFAHLFEKCEKIRHLLHRKLSLLQELQKSLATRAFAGLL